MGLRSSPYICARAFAWCEEIIGGNRNDPNSPLQWEKVMSNLSGVNLYDPSMPLVYRLRRNGKCLVISEHM